MKSTYVVAMTTRERQGSALRSKQRNLSMVKQVVAAVVYAQFAAELLNCDILKYY